MALKRVSPLDEPPTASSSDSEEDNEPSSQEEQPSSEHRQHKQEHDEETSSEEQGDDDDDEEEEDDDDGPVKPSSASQPASKKPQPPSANSQPQKPSYSESVTESDSGSDTDSDHPPASAANPKVKPLASKPMEEAPKPRPQPSATPARSASKRPAENNGHLNDPKRAKKKKVTEMDAASGDDDEDIPATEVDGKKSSGDDSKKQFQRLWSEEDELAILKGMAEFSSKHRADPLKYATAFHDFIKKSLHADASCNQLKQKIRRLKKKFETNAGKGKNGEDPSFTKPHDQKSFELSKKVWANGVVEEKPKSDGNARKSEKEGSKNLASPKPKQKAELLSQDSKEPGKMDIDEKPDSTLHLSEMIRFDKGLGLFGLNEDVVKRGVKLIGASKRAGLEERWKKLQVAELEMYVKRAELIEDQARLILEAYKKSSNH